MWEDKREKEVNVTWKNVALEYFSWQYFISLGSYDSLQALQTLCVCWGGIPLLTMKSTSPLFQIHYYQYWFFLVCTVIRTHTKKHLKTYIRPAESSSIEYSAKSTTVFHYYIVNSRDQRGALPERTPKSHTNKTCVKALKCVILNVLLMSKVIFWH